MTGPGAAALFLRRIDDIIGLVGAGDRDAAVRLTFALPWTLDFAADEVPEQSIRTAKAHIAAASDDLRDGAAQAAALSLEKAKWAILNAMRRQEGSEPPAPNG